MGYTHYLNIEKKALTKDEFCKVAFDMKLIEQHLNDNDIQLGSWDGETEGVEFDFNESHPESFRFNGIKENSHETFSLKIGDEGFSFCKTARKEYDIAVCLILLSVKYHVRRAKISSDGGNEDWNPAFDLFKTIFPMRSKTFKFRDWIENSKKNDGSLAIV
jgi:hypothetical protein